jgi:hypothetical protein
MFEIFKKEISAKIDLIKGSYIEKIQKRKSKIVNSFKIWKQFSNQMKQKSKQSKFISMLPNILNDNKLYTDQKEIQVKKITYELSNEVEQIFDIDKKVNQENLEMFLLDHKNTFLHDQFTSNLKCEINVLDSEESKQEFKR